MAVAALCLCFATVSICLAYLYWRQYREDKLRIAKLVDELVQLQCAVEWWSSDFPGVTVPLPEALVAAHRNYLTRTYLHGLVRSPVTK